MTKSSAPDDTHLAQLGVLTVLTMMRSASTEKIRPLDWWPRAKSALETAATTAESWPHFISLMAKKLQIETVKAITANELCSIATKIEPHFERWRELCERDAVYLVAMAQVERNKEKP
jgi:hypothetical protein